MKLTAKEALILAAAELRPHAPTALLRKETGLREHAIRYALQRLRERRIATPIPFVNLHLLGYNIFNIFFSVGAQRRATKEAMLRSFSQAEEVVWIGEFGGEYQFGIAVCTRSVGSVLQLLTAIAGKYQNVFFEKAVSLQYSATAFPRKYLSSKRFSVRPLQSRVSDERREIDELDHRLLTTLATVGDVSNRQLAQKLGIPASTVDLRVRKLIDHHIIGGHLLAIDCTRFGMQGFKLLIYAKGLNPELAAALMKYATTHPNVTYLIECLGSWDFELGVEVERTEEVTAIIQEIYEQFGAVINTVKLLTKFKEIKYRWYPG